MKNNTSENDKIHHRCHCTGQEFTFDEWIDYLKINSSDKTEHTAGKYKFNIHDACMNPDVELKYNDKYNICSYRITVCQSDNLNWTYGYYYHFHNIYGCGGAKYAIDDKYNKSYKSKREAVLACLDFLLKKAARELKDEERGFMDNNGKIRKSTYCPHIKLAIKHIKTQIAMQQYIQLSLF